MIRITLSSDRFNKPPGSRNRVNRTARGTVSMLLLPTTNPVCLPRTVIGNYINSSAPQHVPGLLTSHCSGCAAAATWTKSLFVADQPRRGGKASARVHRCCWLRRYCVEEKEQLFLPLLPIYVLLKRPMCVAVAKKRQKLRCLCTANLESSKGQVLSMHWLVVTNPWHECTPRFGAFSDQHHPSYDSNLSQYKHS
jgi:hypothetical protein